MDILIGATYLDATVNERIKITGSTYVGYLDEDMFDGTYDNGVTISWLHADHLAELDD